MKKNYFLAAALALVVNTAWSQSSQILPITQNHLINQADHFGLKASDLEDLQISTHYLNSNNKVEYAYIHQHLGGYPIYNAIANLALKDEKVLSMNSTFQQNIHQRIANQSAIQDLNQFASVVAQGLGFVLNESAFLNSDFHNQLMYYPTEDGKLNLSWIFHLNIMEENQLKMMEYVANAQTGEIYASHNHLLSCSFDHGAFENPTTEFKQSENVQWLKEQYQTATLNDNASYRVFKLPVEAPTFGERSMVNNPADPIASPFGWHDTNGAPGHESTLTHGNNVKAVNDQNSAGLNWLYNGGSYTFTGYADGGTNLNFDFPIDFTRNLYESYDASTTNLFYMNNMLHDVWYQYGFTEQAGNFQLNNYGNGGVGTDEVYAFGQTGEAMGSMNNAMFGTPPEGGNPYMIMFMWTSNEGDSHLFAVNTAGTHQGNYNGELASFGPGIPTPPITENLAVVIDDNANGGSNANDGCENIINAAQLNGKIAMIQRGNCDFVVKVKKAQDAGAKAVVMVNNVAGAPIVMGGTDNTITIPSVMISMNDGNPIIDAVLDGTTLNGSVPKDGHWDGYKDGSFDNGIVAHEYGHGISNRLTGGPNTTSCLNNQEQMGEGWSDFIGLVMTIEPGDQGTDGRGIGTYAVSQPTTGVGIRPSRYSTDMSVNSSTYNTIKSVSVPHGVGYVWATMLWEMTWELIGKYGFDPNIYTGTGGNNVAMQLVTDGMKLQPCNPGFVTGRDAILEADLIYNNGENRCHIWKAFAKRGLGFGASQGSPNNVMDGTQSFDMPPTEVLDCTNMATTDLENNSMSLYPNPTKGEFYLLTEKAFGDSNVSIKDVTGKVVQETIVNFSNKRAAINVQNLPAGVYVISVDTADGKITKKLIKK
ncbi:T9SS-dependent M36 family metallopeptidase [Moheibacter stercoris]|uniref:Por secretion system C-terminal sorting domain-containing protein n=1 Tax=Moheibacter stercoris TaxID=1628251 RepID=A0ABV2LU71_9FLAO